MINESLKAWRRKPSDKEWHEMLHGDYYDKRCSFCAERTTSQAFVEEAAYDKKWDILRFSSRKSSR